MSNQEKIEEERKVCCICGCEFIGWGNNPDPVKDKGRCCDSCNERFVIPARIAQLSRRDGK